MVGTATVSGGSNFSNGRSMSSNSTQFMPGGAPTHFTAASSTESNNQLITREPGDYSRIGIRVITADATGTATFRFRKDTGGGGANGNNAASLTTATTGWFQDATPHIDTVADGDKICLAISAASLSVGITYTTTSMKFSAATGAATYYGTYAPDSVGTYSIQSSTSVVRDYSIPMSGGNGGPQGPNNEAANQRQKLRAPGTLSHIHTKITGSNAVASNSTYLFRKNNVDGNQAASITASTLGTFEDTTNSDTIAAADVCVLTWRLPIEGTSHTMNGPRSGFGKFVASGTGYDILASNGTSADSTGSTSASNFYAVFGNATRYTTEASAKTKIPITGPSTFLRCYVATAQTGTLTLTLRVNGSNVNQTLSLTSATTGIFEDVSHTDTITDGDDLTYSHGAMVSTFGFWISWFGLTMAPPRDHRPRRMFFTQKA